MCSYLKWPHPNGAAISQRVRNHRLGIAQVHTVWNSHVIIASYFITGHTFCVLRPIWNRELHRVFDKTKRHQQHNAETPSVRWFTKELQAIQLYIAMKDIPGNHSPSLGKVRPSFATVLLSPLEVTARSNDRVRCTAFYFSQYHFCTVCFSQYNISQRSSQMELVMFCQWQVEAAWRMVHTVGTRVLGQLELLTSDWAL